MSSTQLFKKAVSCHQKNDLPKAEKLYKQAIDADPRHVSSNYNLGLVLQQMGRDREAEDLYKQVISIKPDYANAYNSLGLLYEKQGKYEGAVSNYLRAIEINPDSIFYTNLAWAYVELGNTHEALQSLTRAIGIDNNNVAAHLRLGTVLHENRRLDEAEKHYAKAAKLAPEQSGTWYNLGNLYRDKGDFAKAKDAYEKAIGIDKDDDRAYAGLLLLKQKFCDWDSFGDLQHRVLNSKDKSIVMPFDYLTLCDNPEKNLAAAKYHSEKIKNSADNETGFSFAGRSNKKKITIGYMSADFRQHTFGYIVQYMLMHHDRKKFVINAYATTPDDGGNVRKKFATDSDKFTDISGMDDNSAAQTIYDDEVDMLVNLTCYTDNGRMHVSARKPAPIQVNSWGFTGSTGADFIDYILADEVVIPEEHQQYYSEECIYIPDTLQFNHDNEKFSDKNLKKSDFGLPEDAFVFMANCPAYKFNPQTLEVWSEIMQQVPNSVLWLRELSPIAMENIRTELDKRGVDRSRVLFARRMDDRSEYFKRLQLADLCLDTFIYNGGSTTMDALWAGVPVVTLLGSHYASRMSAGLINGTGMPELITNTLDEYKELAVSLAGNPEKLEKVRRKLWKQRETCALFDAELCVRRLEQAYEEIWERYLSENANQH